MDISYQIFDKIKNKLIVVFLIFEAFLIITIFLGFYTFSRLEGDASHLYTIVSLREKILRTQFDLHSYFTSNDEKDRVNAFRETSSFDDMLGKMKGGIMNNREILSQINDSSKQWEAFKLIVDNALAHHEKVISLKEKVLKEMLDAISANKILGDRLVEVEDENYELYGEIVQDITRKIIHLKTYVDDYILARNQDLIDGDLINITVSLEKIDSYIKGIQYGLEKYNIFPLNRDDLESLRLLAKLSERFLKYQDAVNKTIAERDVLVLSVKNMEGRTNELSESLKEAENLFKGYSEAKTTTKKWADVALLVIALTIILIFFKFLMKIRLIIGKEISEQRELQYRLLQSEKLAGIGTLASGIAHEINNPLGVILGMAEAILEEDDPELVKSYANDIVNSCTNAATIVKELTDYSRTTAGKTVSSLDITVAMKNSIKMAKHASNFSSIEVVSNFKEGLCWINANLGEMQQVFTNLIINAVHAMEENRAKMLTLSCTKYGQWIEALIADTGKGIKKEHLKQIFDPFFTTKGEGKGTGLGLYIVYKIVTKNNGRIDVVSKEGEGTTFKITFPLARDILKEPSEE